MESARNLIIVFLIITVVFAGGYYLFFVDKEADKKQRIDTRQEVSESKRITQELIDKYQAITDWDENLRYTLQAQERLLTGQPVLFKGYVDDVFERRGRMFVRFSSSFLSHVDYVLELECDRTIVDKILAREVRRLWFSDDYIIIANIQEVSKPVIALRGSALSEGEVEIDIGSSTLFTARGTCVDIAYIPYIHIIYSDGSRCYKTRHLTNQRPKNERTSRYHRTRHENQSTEHSRARAVARPALNTGRTSVSRQSHFAQPVDA